MITAIIPARSGSKRLPGKNVKLLDGRPILFFTIEAVLGHENIKKVIFTTDSERYIDLVHDEFGDRVELERRPDALATDQAKVRDEVIRLDRAGLIDTEWFMLCLPTAPFRSFDTVARLLAEWRSDRIARFSAAKYDFPIQFGFEINDQGFWLPCFDDSPMITGNTRSQDISPRYRPTGAIYLQKTQSLRSSPTFYLDAKPFLTDEMESLDVDTVLDLKTAESLLELISNRG